MPGAAGRDDAAPLRLSAEPGDRDVTVAKAAAVLRIKAPRISSRSGLRDCRCGRGGASVCRRAQPGEDDDGAGAFVKIEIVIVSPLLLPTRSHSYWATELPRVVPDTPRAVLYTLLTTE